MKTKSKGLTKQERYQFSLTGSSAKTVAAQRAAIARCGLTDATPATVLKARRESFRKYREQQTDLAGLPNWLAATRWAAAGDDWRHDVPTPHGVFTDVRELAHMAHDGMYWGRLRKHSLGNATAFPPHVREETNGKSGWVRVVWRYADYLCVMSPNHRQIAVQVDQKPIELHAIWRNRFLFRGRVMCIEKPSTSAASNYAQRLVRLRAKCKLLRRAGYDARMVRQTSEMVTVGRGESLRSGGAVYCVIPDGLGNWYHVQAVETVDDIRAALTKRRINARNRELDEIVKQSANRIWVTVDDSVNAGNCRPGTDAFRATVEQHVKAEGEIGAVRADVVLAMRSDTFTQAALRVAALRFK